MIESYNRIDKSTKKIKKATVNVIEPTSIGNSMWCATAYKLRTYVCSVDNSSSATRSELARRDAPAIAADSGDGDGDSALNQSSTGRCDDDDDDDDDDSCASGSA
jgi:hypothetical protein